MSGAATVSDVVNVLLDLVAFSDAVDVVDVGENGMSSGTSRSMSRSSGRHWL